MINRQSLRELQAHIMQAFNKLKLSLMMASSPLNIHTDLIPLEWVEGQYTSLHY
jgi:hypothetical protein